VKIPRKAGTVQAGSSVHLAIDGLGVVGRGMILSLAFVYFAVSPQVRHDGKVAAASFDFAGKRFTRGSAYAAS